MMGSGFGFGFGIPGLGMLITWGIIIVLVILVVRGISGKSRNIDRNDAMETLDKRYSRGEIDREKYEEMKKVLTGV